jgi:esterase/lipase superfamily enzyme
MHQEARVLFGARVLSRDLPTRSLLLAATLGLALACGGCAGRPTQGVLIPVAAAAEGASRVQVLAATNRRRSSTDPGEMFSGERADDMSYASVTVSIPPDGVRKIGEVQWPETLPGDPARNFVTVAADHLDRQSFRAGLAAAVRKNGRGKVLVFVHGFNNRFDDAVYRFAQIVHDAKAPAVPVLFTWPSRGETRLRAYTYDRESANYSRDALEELLNIIAAQPGVTEVNVLAHSMGNWITLEALRTSAVRAGRIGHKVANVMLVAPDVDVDVFRTQIRRMGAARPRFALFVSQDDQVLSVSQFIWGGVPRLGEVDPEQEPYRSEFEREKIAVFDLTKLKGEAHGRAFENVPEVVAMVRQRFGAGQQMTERPPDLLAQVQAGMN